MSLAIDDMLLQILPHSKTTDLLISKDGSHGFIRGETQLVLGVLKSLILQVGPDSLETLCFREFYFLREMIGNFLPEKRRPSCSR